MPMRRCSGGAVSPAPRHHAPSSRIVPARDRLEAGDAAQHRGLAAARTGRAGSRSRRARAKRQAVEHARAAAGRRRRGRRSPAVRAATGYMAVIGAVELSNAVSSHLHLDSTSHGGDLARRSDTRRRAAAQCDHRCRQRRIARLRPTARCWRWPARRSSALPVAARSFASLVGAAESADTCAHLSATVLPRRYAPTRLRCWCWRRRAAWRSSVRPRWLVATCTFPGQRALRVGADAAAGDAGLRDGLRVHRLAAVRRPGADGAARAAPAGAAASTGFPRSARWRARR